MKLDKNQIKEIKQMIDLALSHLYRNDISLISRKSHERSIAFRFALYFSKLFEVSTLVNIKDIHIDLEYNRDLNEPKRTPKFPNGIVPDLLVHKRESYKKDILVIEFKTFWNSSNKKSIKTVNKKLKELTCPENKYKFQIGVLVTINSRRDQVEINYYKKGEVEN